MNRNLNLSFAFCFFTFQLFGQTTPQALNYQAIARDAQGIPMPNQSVQVIFSILDGSVSGPAVYVENHDATTNTFGLFTLSIGFGTPQSGLFTSINWGNGSKFLKVDINNSLQGVSQLLSVPYALYAEKTNIQPGNGIIINGNTISATDNSATNEIQTLSLSGDQLSLSSSGGTVTLPAGSIYMAGQGISIVGNTITNTGDADNSTTNELQTISLNGNQLSLSNSGGTVTLPTSGGGDNWGTQVVSTAPTLSGNGTVVSPLTLAQQGAVNGQILKWSGTAWLPANDEIGTSGIYTAGPGISINANVINNTGDTDPTNDLTTTSTAGGDLTGIFSNLQISSNTIGSAEIINGSVTAADLASGVIPTALPPNGTAGGDLNGTYPSPTVNRLQGKPLSTTSPTTGQVLQWDGSKWMPTTPATTTGWSLTGNSGTNSNVNFIGTTDDKPLLLKTNNKISGKIEGTNTFFGVEAGVVATGSSNTATGYNALKANSSGSRNTTSGYNAMLLNTTGNQNTTSGYESLYSNTTGNYNTASGYKPLYSNTNGNSNTAFGYKTMNYNTTGDYNTAVGEEALFYSANGDYNTAVGYHALHGNSASNKIGIGYNATGFVDDVSNSASIGNSSINKIGGQVNWTATSDARTKTNVHENVPGLSFIQKLRPVTYHYDIHRQNALLGIVDTATWEGKYDIEKMTFSGFLAQEVEQAAQSLGYEFSGVDAPKNEKGLYGLRYAEFVVPVVKAIQEQQVQIEQLQAENQALKAQMQQQNEDLFNTLKTLQAEVKQLKDAASSTVSPDRR